MDPIAVDVPDTTLTQLAERQTCRLAWRLSLPSGPWRNGCRCSSSRGDGSRVNRDAVPATIVYARSDDKGEGRANQPLSGVGGAHRGATLGGGDQPRLNATAPDIGCDAVQAAQGDGNHATGCGALYRMPSAKLVKWVEMAASICYHGRGSRRGVARGWPWIRKRA